jgi:hypothetical protein
MADGVWARVTAALARVDYMLTYGLVTFVDRVFATYFSRVDIVLVAAVAAAVTAHGKRAGVLGQTGESVRRVAAILLANGVLASLPAASASETSGTVLVLHWLLSTAAAVLLPTLAAPFATDEVLAQVASLTLFAYAENASFITRALHADYVLAALAALALHAAHGVAGAGGALGVALRALGMLATNVLVSALLRGTAGDALEVAALLGALVVLDHLRPWLEAAGELRDYATWKASTLAAARLAGSPRDAVFGAVAGAVGLACGLRDAARLRFDAVIDVGVLVAANVAFAAAEDAVRALPASLVWVALLAVVNVVHVALAASGPVTVARGVAPTHGVTPAR